ncbi:MAG: hypothetical protein ACYSWP_06795, partial [Planctomycetota bacterium]
IEQTVDFLVDEIENRTGIRLGVSDTKPRDNKPAIVIGAIDKLSMRFDVPKNIEVPQKADAYAIWTESTPNKGPAIYLVGHDLRGTLFAAGRFIRLAKMGKGKLSIESSVKVTTAPKYPIRGHMLISDGDFIKWDRDGHEQLIRDMVIFGTNSYELIKCRGYIAEILDSYDLDLWIFYGKAGVVDVKSVEDVRRKFGQLKGLDHVFIPLGDTGGIKPSRVMMPAIERFVPMLEEVHPDARIWLSYQCQKAHAVHDNEYVFGYLREHQPKWLEGMLYGPWSRGSIEDARRWTPEQYKLRHYPDISHCRWSQYMLPKWDWAFATVWERNGIRAMPRTMAKVHNATAELSDGFIAYNHTGCNNDLSKFVWSAMAWNPEADIEQVVWEYAKVFFGDEFADDVAKGLFMLEDNWTGPIADNSTIETTLEHWQKIAKRYGDVSKNWRMELHLYKAFIDAYIKRKYDLEIQLETQAYAKLKSANKTSVATAIKNARQILAKVDSQYPAKEQLKKELESWGLSRFHELDKTLERLYYPLNDRRWLEAQFDKVLAIADTTEQATRLDRIVNWEDAGPGGFYDNLGVEGEQPHLVRQKSWEQDPGFVHSPMEFHRYDDEYRKSWMMTELARYDTPLLMRYAGLDKNAKYRLRVTYSGPFKPEMRLIADGRYEIHKPMGLPEQMRPIEFEVPQGATSDGILELKWELTNVVRGSQVAEVWLIKE